jgi:RNA polymerase sigma-70 factor (ECF subfamily)
MMTAGSKPRVDEPANVSSGFSDQGGTSVIPPFKEIYKIYFNFVWSSAGHLGAPKDAIDDLVQDVFLVIHDRLHTLQRPEALRSWIYGIVRRTISDHRRARRTRETLGATLGAEPKPSHPSPLDVTEMNSDLAILKGILASLDEQKREIFVMVEVLEMSVPEVAQAIEIPLNTAYSRLRNAREAFNQALALLESREKEIRRP